ncbi:MAG TPA: hypothetical protein VN758_12745 [Solirubrobacterales bacterium]|nr:hypothetical protein [Solirubrobacterales bacterium]
MKLARFAVLQIGVPEENDDWRSFSLKTNEIGVTSLTAWDSKEEVEVLVGAFVPLPAPPVLTDAGMIEVPRQARLLAEAAIESTANHISVFRGTRCGIVSPRLPVAFHSEDPSELQPLRDAGGIADGDLFVAGDYFTLRLDPVLIRDLDDREDGVALLASALATTDLSAKYRELLRVFERAFARTSTKLAVCLTDFLGVRPVLGYTKPEVKEWVAKLRGRTVHADRDHRLLVAADYRPVVHRMLFAAYDVLLNKHDWHSPEGARRTIWSPTHGPRADGGMVAIGGETGAVAMEMLDCYSAFSMSANSLNFQLEDDFWPRTGPPKMTGKPQTLQVVGAEDFGPVERAA